MAQFAGNADWVRPSTLSPIARNQLHSKLKNEYLVLALRKVTAVHAVVVCIVCALHRLKKSMSAIGYALLIL